MARLCLNMIVKNEAAIIARCLNSVAPYIDYYVICDTGSIDDTPKVIRQIMDELGVPGEIHEIEFHTFSQARNAALDAARASAGEFDYMLLCDADMELNVDNPDFAANLTADAYLVRQANAITYSNVRLVRRDRPSHYVGATHEYISTDTSAVDLDGLWFRDYADGGNRHEKIERDIRLLAGALEEDPDDARSWFYLAQTFKDAGKHEEAIEAYQTRIELGGWDEEVWYSRYMIATCHARLGDFDQLLVTGMEAYQARPHRAEPLYLLAHHARLAGKNDLALMFALQGVRVPFPHQDRLFIENHVYEGGFDEELSVCSFYVADPLGKEIGREACFRMLTDRRTSAVWRYRARGNARFYVQSAEEHFGAFANLNIAIPLDPGWSPSNPSVTIARGQRWCVLRTVNYYYGQDLDYHSNDPDGVIRTRNFMLLMDANWNVADYTEIIDDTADQTFPTMVRGFEDCRLVDFDGRWVLSATVGDRIEPREVEIAVLEMSDDFHVTQTDVQREGFNHSAQKNWMPFVENGDLHFIYSLEPITILQFDQTTRNSEIVYQEFAPISMDGLRGGSQLVKIPGGWLCATHEVFAEENTRRTYLHRFVMLDDESRLIGLTDPFYFEHKGIEFCAGMAYDEERNQLVVSYGVHDGQARLGFLHLPDVLRALQSPMRTPVYA